MNKFDHVTFSSNILDPNVNFCNFSCRYFGAKFQISDRPSIHEKSIFGQKLVFCPSVRNEVSSGKTSRSIILLTNKHFFLLKYNYSNTPNTECIEERKREGKCIRLMFVADDAACHV